MLLGASTWTRSLLVDLTTVDAIRPEPGRFRAIYAPFGHCSSALTEIEWPYPDGLLL
jgi:hypothetical protein